MKNIEKEILNTIIKTLEINSSTNGTDDALKLRNVIKTLIPIMKVLTSDENDEDKIYLLPDYKEYLSLPENSKNKTKKTEII